MGFEYSIKIYNTEIDTIKERFYCYKEDLFISFYKDDGRYYVFQINMPDGSAWNEEAFLYLNREEGQLLFHNNDKFLQSKVFEILKNEMSKLNGSIEFEEQ